MPAIMMFLFHVFHCHVMAFYMRLYHEDTCHWLQR